MAKACLEVEETPVLQDSELSAAKVYNKPSPRQEQWACPRKILFLPGSLAPLLLDPQIQGEGQG